ncbi:MAG: gamma-glutamyltransferase [Clostridiales Family XIII bacterium]|jgi:gamma-glutamyltranspeptidase/glutathione hydrolase|nr:gamma-glutamyltransferase [Clostridiales Family XIII bacterium]
MFTKRFKRLLAVLTVIAVVFSLHACDVSTPKNAEADRSDGEVYENAAATGDDRGTRPFGESFGGRSVAMGRDGMVASSSVLASNVMNDILEMGGNAVDAAIAGNAMMQLTEPHMCSVGGDMFAIIWDPQTEEVVGLNASGTSSNSVSYEDMVSAVGDDGAMPLAGPLSVTIPGVVDGWIAMHERYGKLSLGEVLAPAIAYAREGVPVTESESELWALGLVELIEDEGADESHMRELYNIFYPNGEAPKKGEIFKNPQIAETFSLIAEKGRAGFYEGAVAESIAGTLQKYGATLTLEDLAGYRSEWVTPISTNYRGYDVYELPPNGHGLTALELLNIMENFDVASMGRDSAEFWHIFLEAKKLAYEDRPLIAADPAFSELPAEALLSKEYAKQRAAGIDVTKANSGVSSGLAPTGKGDTTYVTAADRDGMMVSLIQSVYGLMGSGVAVEPYGFALQNRGSLFSLDRNSPNVYAPGKRPFHTIIPGFAMKDGLPFLSFGVCGGDYQPMGHAQFLMNVIDFGYDIQEAIDAARIRHKGQTDPASGIKGEDGFMAELGISPEIVGELIDRGHPFIRQDAVASDLSGSIQAIMYDADNGVWYGASEMRADGAAIGY